MENGHEHAQNVIEKFIMYINTHFFFQKDIIEFVEVVQIVNEI